MNYDLEEGGIATVFADHFVLDLSVCDLSDNQVVVTGIDVQKITEIMAGVE